MLEISLVCKLGCLLKTLLFEYGRFSSFVFHSDYVWTEIYSHCYDLGGDSTLVITFDQILWGILLNHLGEVVLEG